MGLAAGRGQGEEARKQSRVAQCCAPGKCKLRMRSALLLQHAAVACGVNASQQGAEVHACMRTRHPLPARRCHATAHTPQARLPAYLGPQGDLHRIRQLLHARQQAGPALIAEAQLLGGIAARLKGLEGLQRRRAAAAAAVRQKRGHAAPAHWGIV